MSREITIAGHRIADDTDAWVIAELGHNHQGNLETAKQMIRAAAAAGADAVKLQTRSNRELYTEEAYGRLYASENAFGATYGEHREALEFHPVQYAELQNEADAAGTAMFSTSFDKMSAWRLDVMNMPCFKIASSDVVNLPLLEYVAQFNKPVIMSTGAATMAEVDRAVNTVYKINPQLVLLACTAEYPVRVDHLNLRVIETFRSRYPELVIGLSSHYSGISDAIVAYALGARVVEKHFTLDRTMRGSDHAFSLEPSGLAKMCSYLKKARLMLGSGEKTVFEEEYEMIAKMRETTRWYQEMHSDAVR